jgi:hypothetical protein
MANSLWPLTCLSFRPQGEILDPSHPFGMTTHLPRIATQSLAGEGQDRGNE